MASPQDPQWPRESSTADGSRAVDDGQAPAWRRRTAAEPRWHVALVVLIAIGLQLALPAHLGLQPKFVLPALEVALLVGLVAANPGRLESHHPALRYGGLALVGLVSGANAVSAVLLIRELLHSAGPTGSAGALLTSGGSIYATNVVVFGLWYWDFDRGGPTSRAHAHQPYPDLMFPQMSSPALAPAHWEPRLLDYLYVSFTNATAFSPTDTMPMSRWAKGLMAAQSSIALVTLALVIARAVNILK